MNSLASSLLWQATLNANQIGTAADAIVSYLSQCRPFCLWLVGDLGSGKTTISGEILRRLGLPKNVPVLSPTFTYLTEYELFDQHIAHVDLYRMPVGQDESVTTLFEGREYSGILVEWPERCPGAEPIKPNYILKIEFKGDETRDYLLFAGSTSL